MGDVLPRLLLRFVQVHSLFQYFSLTHSVTLSLSLVFSCTPVGSKAHKFFLLRHTGLSCLKAYLFSPSELGPSVVLLDA